MIVIELGRSPHTAFYKHPSLSSGSRSSRLVLSGGMSLFCGELVEPQDVLKFFEKREKLL